MCNFSVFLSPFVIETSNLKMCLVSFGSNRNEIDGFRTCSTCIALGNSIMHCHNMTGHNRYTVFLLLKFPFLLQTEHISISSQHLTHSQHQSPAKRHLCMFCSLVSFMKVSTSFNSAQFAIILSIIVPLYEPAGRPWRVIKQLDLFAKLFANESGDHMNVSYPKTGCLHLVNLP